MAKCQRCEARLRVENKDNVLCTPCGRSVHTRDGKWSKASKRDKIITAGDICASRTVEVQLPFI